MTIARSTRVSFFLLILAAPLASSLAAPLPTRPPVQLATEEAPVAPAPPIAPLKTTNPPLDIEGMRRSVREAGMVDTQATPSTSTSTSTSTSVFSSAPPADVERFKQKFNDSKRGWCLTAFQGMGVLALVAMPLATLFDKKDHGCKW